MNPGLVTSTGRFMWIKFTSDEELEGLGFRIKYTFIAGRDTTNCIFAMNATSQYIVSSFLETSNFVGEMCRELDSFALIKSTKT